MFCKGSCVHYSVSSLEVRWQHFCRTQLNHTPQPPRISGNCSLICLFTDEADMLTFELEHPLLQSRAALLHFRMLSLPAGCLLLPSHSSPAWPTWPCLVILLPCFYCSSDPIPRWSTSSWACGTSQGLPGQLHRC